MKKRILVCQFHQESNTFNPLIWGLDRFGPAGNLEGAQRLQVVSGSNTVLRGGITALEEAGCEIVPTVFLYATSGGRVADEVLQYLNQRMTHYAQTEEFNGIFAYLHGAGSSNLQAMPFENLPQNLYPFCDIPCPETAEIW